MYCIYIYIHIREREACACVCIYIYIYMYTHITYTLHTRAWHALGNIDCTTLLCPSRPCRDASQSDAMTCSPKRPRANKLIGPVVVYDPNSLGAPSCCNVIYSTCYTISDYDIISNYVSTRSHVGSGELRKHRGERPRRVDCDFGGGRKSGGAYMIVYYSIVSYDVMLYDIV